jgi:hypothetical protein
LDNVSFVKEVQEECIEGSIEHDIELLSSKAPESFNDSTLHDLAKAWQTSDQNTKKIFQQLMYLSSKNSIAIILHLIDTQFIMEKNINPLNITDLLGLFMDQSESSDTEK